MRARFLAPVLLVGAGSAATAAEPTLDQLLATPSADDIVSKWKAVCLDHAGDTKAQKRTARELGIDWPYQAMFVSEAGKPVCLIVSSTDLETTSNAVGDALVAASAPIQFQDIQQTDGDFNASTVIAGSVFRVQAKLSPSQGAKTAVVALIDMKEKRP